MKVMWGRFSGYIQPYQQLKQNNTTNTISPLTPTLILNNTTKPQRCKKKLLV